MKEIVDNVRFTEMFSGEAKAKEERLPKEEYITPRKRVIMLGSQKCLVIKWKPFNKMEASTLQGH